MYICICMYICIHICMPKMDGPTATKTIRDLGYTAPIFGQ
jgi:CheY-like chemotaxis protein